MCVLEVVLTCALNNICGEVAMNCTALANSFEGGLWIVHIKCHASGRHGTATACRLQEERDIKGLCLAFSFASACLFYFFEMARRARSSERSSGAAVWLWGFVG